MRAGWLALCLAIAGTPVAAQNNGAEYQLQCSVVITSVAGTGIPAEARARFEGEVRNDICKGDYGPFSLKSSTTPPLLRVSLFGERSQWTYTLQYVASADKNITIGIPVSFPNPSTDDPSKDEGQIKSALRASIQGELPKRGEDILLELVKNKSGSAIVERCSPDERDLNEMCAVIPVDLGKWLRISRFQVTMDSQFYFASGQGVCNKVDSKRIPRVYVRFENRSPSEGPKETASVSLDAYRIPRADCVNLQPKQSNVPLSTVSPQ